jgi:general secretion pathway protein K
MMRALANPDARRHDAGYVTISVLLVCSLLATIAAGLLTTPRPTLGRSLIDLQMVEVEALLDSGLDLAAFRLFGADSGDEGWHSDAETIALENGRVVVEAGAETGRVDVNWADAEFLANLYSEVGATSMPAASFADRVLALRSARDAQTQVSGTLTTIGDLAAIDGLASDDFARLSPHLTVFGGIGQVDPWSADRQVLRAVPEISLREVERILSARQARSATGDETILEIARDHADYLSTQKPQRFRVTVDAWAENGLAGRAEAIIEDGTDQDPFTVLAWARRPITDAGRGKR